MSVRIVRLGSPRTKTKACASARCAAPRGVPKSEFASQDWYDVWYPNLAPSDFSVGCYCQDEAHCYRSVLRALLDERGARLKAG